MITLVQLYNEMLMLYARRSTFYLVKTGVVFLSVFFTINASAQPDIFQKEKFQYKADILIDDSSPMQMIVVPESVQSTLYYQDARDIRVYNANGELVPSVVTFEANKVMPSIIKELRFYPINSEGNEIKQDPSINHSANIALNVELTINAENKNTDVPLEDKIQNPGIYIIENSQYEKMQSQSIPVSGGLTQIIIEWEGAFEGIAGLRLESSDDLNNWHNLISKENIVNMRFMDQQLTKNILPISSRASRYIKLIWLDDQRPVIKTIKAKFGQEMLKLNYEWTQNLPLQRVNEKNISPNTFDVHISPAFRADRFRVVTKEMNQIYTGNLKTKKSLKHQWENFTDFQFYQVDTGNGKITSLERFIGTNIDRYWRINFQYPQSPKVNDVVAIQVNRYPLSVYFLRQGNEPFYLAYSNESIAVQPEKLTSIVSGLVEKNAVKYGVAHLSTQSIVEPWVAPLVKTPTDWKKITLWVVLVLGVLLMMFMAKSLFHQMGRESSPQ